MYYVSKLISNYSKEDISVLDMGEFNKYKSKLGGYLIDERNKVHLDLKTNPSMPRYLDRITVYREIEDLAFEYVQELSVMSVNKPYPELDEKIKLFNKIVTTYNYAANQLERKIDEFEKNIINNHSEDRCKVLEQINADIDKDIAFLKLQL